MGLGELLKNMGNKVKDFSLTDALLGKQEINPIYPESTQEEKNISGRFNELIPLRNYQDFFKNNQDMLNPYEKDIVNKRGLSNIISDMELGKNNGIRGIANNLNEVNKSLEAAGAPFLGQGPTVNSDTLREAWNNQQERLSNPGLSATQKSSGILSDVISGYEENRNNKFDVNNLNPSNKSFAGRIGEGLGTLSRFSSTPLGRGVMAAGTIGALGGTPAQMIAYGGGAGVMNQKLHSQNDFYRKALQGQGLDTSGIKGWVGADEFKNYSLNDYRNKNLQIKQQLGTIKDVNQQKTYIERLWRAGMISALEAQQLLSDTGFNLVNTYDSNQTRQTNMNEQILPHRINALDAGVNLGYENLELKKQESAVDIPLKQVQTAKILQDYNVGNSEERKTREALNSVASVAKQVDAFKDTFRVMPSKMNAYTGGNVRKFTGLQTPGEVNFNAQRTLLYNKIARDLGGEKGVLSDYDIKNVELTLPNLTDSYEQKQAKLAAVEQLIKIRVQQHTMNRNSGQSLDPLGIR